METQTASANLPALEEKVTHLFELQKITLKDIEDFTRPEREYLSAAMTETLRHLKGTERDSFIEKIKQIVPENMNDLVWEHNHFVIGRAITKLMNQYGAMPPKTLIAEETGLSRYTVTKHLANYKLHPEHQAEVEQFKYLAPKILAGVCNAADNGDVKAARLYFEMIGSINKQQGNTVVNKQNNYIQVNNTILSQEKLSHLSAEQLNQIERIIMNNPSY